MTSLRLPDHHEFDSLDRAHWTVDDWKAIFALAALFAIMIVGSWQRWTQPIIDHGREMNLPARILAGEQLYVDVQFLYGPLAPYVNASLYRVFGVRLAVLHMAGGICAWIIILSVYWLSRQLMGVREAGLTAGLVLVICAIRYSGNYISPYAYAALYGLVLAIASLTLTTRYWRDERPQWLYWSGLLAGLALISKWEIALTAISTGIAAILLSSLVSRRVLWKDALRFLTPLVAVPAVTMALILNRVSWRTLLDENHVFFTGMPPQLHHFNGLISGVAMFPKSLWQTVSGLGVFAFWFGVIVMLGAVSKRRREEGWLGLARTGFVITASGLVFWMGLRGIFGLSGDGTLLTAMPIILPVVIVAIVVQIVRLRGTISRELGLILLFSVFAQVSILRVILRVTTSGPYAAFILPMVIVVTTFLLLSFLPSVVTPAGGLREAVRRTALLIIGLLVIGMAVGSIRRFRSHNTFEVSSPRGRFKAPPQLGIPVAGALRYLEQHTSPGDFVATLPQATSINFLSGRAYPYRQEIVHPGFLTDAEGIARLEESNVPVVLVVNLLSPEFEDRVFGLDYNVGLWRWLNKHYHQAARFDSTTSRGAAMGDVPFFILAFERNP